MLGNPIPAWEKDGFAAPTSEHASKGTEKVMRCYSREPFIDQAGNRHGSFQYGNCFWVFRAGLEGGPIGNRTINRETLNIDFLEANLNAALWNNTYQRVGVFQMREGVRYRIGPIGQNTRGAQRVLFAKDYGPNREVTPDKPVYLTHEFSFDYTSPVKELLQVVLCVPHNNNSEVEFLRDVLTLISEYPVKGHGRYMGNRSTHARN